MEWISEEQVTMKIFRNIGNAMARFMYGRNGVDQLNLVLIISVLLLDFAKYPAANFSALFANILASGAMALWVIFFFRFFSKNLSKRRSENAVIATWWSGIRRKSKDAKQRHDDKNHKYFTCKQCKTICRVPVGKGKVVITCPKCKDRIEAKT